MEKYNYNGEALNEKELINKLLKDNVVKNIKEKYVKLYVYVFDFKYGVERKKYVHNVIPHKNGSFSFKMNIDNEFEATKNILKEKLSTNDSIKMYKCSGFYRKVYGKYVEEADTRGGIYLGGTYRRHIYYGEEWYIDGKIRGEKYYNRDRYSYHTEILGECNGVRGERYEIYSLEPLDEKKLNSITNEYKG